MKTTSHVALHAFVLICAGLVFSGATLEAQQDRTFEEERRITAIDLVLGFESGAFRDWATQGALPSGLRAQDFEILYDGQPRPVVALEPGAGTWQIVLYFDAALTSSGGLRWAATALAGRSAELTALGEVTIVVADPAPWTMLAATRDRDRLNASLSHLARFQEGRDELLALRAQATEEWKDRTSDPDMEDDELLAALTAEETRIVRARHDDLLLELTESGGVGPYRALLVASGGYDLQPWGFYRSLIERPASERPANSTTLESATEILARTLAAYGWVVMPLLPPEADPLKEGVRVGKLRLTGPSIEAEEQRATPNDWESYDRTVLRLFGGRLEGRRKPKRAEAYLELGAALHDQGKLPEAEDALRQAIYHFAGDPKTAERQALTLARLGAVLDARGESQEANAAWRLARRLDPEVEVAGTGPIAALLDARGPLDILAHTTGGAVVSSAKTLAGALDGLQRRIWLTYQIAGVPDGELHALEARFKGSRSLIYPGWARSSTPESVSAARVRRLLAGEPTGGELTLDAEFMTAAGLGPDRRGELQVAFEPIGGTNDDSESEAHAVLRLSLGVGGPDVDPTVEHRPLGLQARPGTWTYSLGFEMPEDRSWLAVLVEDLETGAWGGRLIEVP